ncbi:Peptidase M20D, amidohydrolase [alpha proteobacterium BAL199]|jgi:amidohydrolase|nr:Peptidase M20D, amidohydrolase [alpha proteobacterium BAL199]
MPVINRIAEFHEELTRWRREMHSHPETAFEEVWTSDFIAKRLAEIGVDRVERGIAKTGIVATIKGQGTSSRTIGLRADFDALDITETTGKPWASTLPGKMHACGHDGHTTMLLGAAKYLTETRNFDGTVVLIFQPAEENEGGGRVMVEEGLFERFPVDAVYGMHNRPGLALGKMCMRSGAAMAGFDVFEIIIHGYGGHAARPHTTIDPVVVQAHIVQALQTIASRSIDPLDSVVVSITQVHGGDTWNVIPETVVLRGTVRAFRTEVQDRTEATMRRLCDNVAAAFDASVDVRYERRYPPLSNDAEHVELCAGVAKELFGEENVDTNPAPVMGSEDFAFMLNARPGAYVNIGNGVGKDGGVMVHNPGYDFNDAALPHGASFWARLVETQLPRAS